MKVLVTRDELIDAVHDEMYISYSDAEWTCLKDIPATLKVEVEVVHDFTCPFCGSTTQSCPKCKEAQA